MNSIEYNKIKDVTVLVVGLNYYIPLHDYKLLSLATVVYKYMYSFISVSPSHGTLMIWIGTWTNQVGRRSTLPGSYAASTASSECPMLRLL